MVYAIAIVACAIGFPFYWGFTHGPDSTIEKMFDGMAITGEPGYCVDASVKEQVQLGLGAIIMQNGLTKDVESGVVKTEKKDDGTATVSVKLSSGNKSAMVEFSLKKKLKTAPIMAVNNQKYQYSLLLARPSIVMILEKHV